MKNIFSLIEKYLLLAIAGVHAANSVQGATNADKKSVVLSTVVAVGDAVSAASGDPKLQAISAAIDVIATVVNHLTAKTEAAPVAQ